MAVTRLSDAVLPSVFQRYMLEDSTVKTSLFSSGIFRPDDSLMDFLSGGGLTVNVPFWKDLDETDPGIANDDSTSTGTPGNLSSGQSIAIRNIRTRGWSTADLVSELAGSDPMARIRTRVAAYWERAFQRHLVSTLVGVFAQNTASSSGDMQNVIGTDANSAITSAELISADAILDTKQTMGDAGEGLSTLIMHSVVYTRLQKQNLIDFIPDSEGRVHFPTYLGYNVIVNDNVKVVTGTYRTKYSTYLMGTGSLAWAEKAVETPVEVYRRPDQGNGMGVEQLWTRRQYIMHPYGFKWLDASRAGNFATNAECETAGNWTRVASSRKLVPIAQLITNG
jgi:hypothetical protein